YETRGLQPGTYGLIVDWEGRKVGKLAAIPPGEPTWRIDIDLPDLWLSGEVVDSETHLPLQASVMASQIRQGPQPASYTSVMSDEEGSVEFSSSPQSRGQADPQGLFRLPLLEPASYRVVALASGYRMEQPVEVDVRASRGDLVLELAPAIELFVKAVDAATGKALDLSCASVSWGSDRQTSCGDGAGRLTSLRPGPMVVAVEVANYAPGFQKLELTADRKEIVIPMTHGGRLQLLLPAGMKNDEPVIWNSRLRIEDGAGTELTTLFTSLRPWLGAGGGSSGEEGTVLIPHAPPGRLKISLGDEGTGIDSKQAEVSVEEGGEAVADLR
ncbi:MAG: carboxypeptidase-like regulatory domain-containing protein, partial [Acidobacteria bacterium]|nr:carboxypeptidase-like regulatory domain-containing protein [Acidobacteriota bacterium]